MRCRGTVKKFAAKLFFQFNLRAYPGLGPCSRYGIAKAFSQKRSWLQQQQPMDISIVKSGIYIDKLLTQNVSGDEETTDGASVRVSKHAR
jgi:hypothetical protein